MGRASKRKKTMSREGLIGAREGRGAGVDPMLQAVATHEAAHVVAILATRQEVEYAWIKRHGPDCIEGYTQAIEPPWFKDQSVQGFPPDLALEDEEKGYLTSRMVPTLSGAVGEAYLAALTGVELGDDTRDPTSDRQQAMMMACIVSGGQSDAARQLYNEKWCLACSLVECNWPAIMAVSRFLMEHGRISHEEIHTLLGPERTSPSPA